MTDILPASWLTRSQVAEQLGVSVSKVRRLEGDTLHPEQDTRGVHRFDPAAIGRIVGQSIAAVERAKKPARKRDPGDVAADVMRSFEAGAGLAEVVIRLRIEPKRVRELFHEWKLSLERREVEHFGSASTKLPPSVSLESLAGLIGSLPTGNAINIAVAELGDEEYGRNERAFRDIAPRFGFVVHGPFEIDRFAIYGQGAFRVMAVPAGQTLPLWAHVVTFQRQRQA